MQLNNRFVVLSAVFFFLVSGLSYAAETKGEVAEGRQGKIREVQERMRKMKMWKLTETIDLDESTISRISSIFDEQNKKREALFEEKKGILDRLREEVDSEEPNEQELQSLIEKFKANSDAIHRLKGSEIEALRGILSVAQLAEYILFEESFQREMRGMIREARRGDRAPGE